MVLSYHTLSGVQFLKKQTVFRSICRMGIFMRQRSSHKPPSTLIVDQMQPPALGQSERF